MASKSPRILKELTSIAKLGDKSDIGAQAVDGDIFHWIGYLNGPIGTPYEGRRFLVDIKLPSDYPFSPPAMKFITRLWHPNVSSQTGFICLDILNKEWSPALTIRTVLLSLQALLSSPNVDDPQDGVVANQLRQDPALFRATAKEWTEKFGSPISGTIEPPFEYPKQLEILLEMGFDEDKAKTHIVKAKGNVEQALAALYSQ